MTDIELIIKIPEKYKKLLDSGEVDGSVRKSILLAVVNGTQLPKGHGALKDADALILNNKDYIVTTADLESEVRNEMVGWINEDIENAPTIIEAERE